MTISTPPRSPQHDARPAEMAGVRSVVAFPRAATAPRATAAQGIHGSRARTSQREQGASATVGVSVIPGELGTSPVTSTRNSARKATRGWRPDIAHGGWPAESVPRPTAAVSREGEFRANQYSQPHAKIRHLETACGLATGVRLHPESTWHAGATCEPNIPVMNTNARRLTVGSQGRATALQGRATIVSRDGFPFVQTTKSIPRPVPASPFVCSTLDS